MTFISVVGSAVGMMGLTYLVTESILGVSHRLERRRRRQRGMGVSL